MDFTKLSRRHGIKVVSDVGVEECSLAVAELVGPENIASASRMNRAVVIFIKSVDLANALVLSGIVIKDTFHTVMPLNLPSKKIVISNVPPFLPDDMLERELARHGKLVSKISKIPLGCKSPLLKHVVSFRRQAYMIINNGDALNLTLRFKFDGADYVVFVTSDTVMKCFVCSEIGHLARTCPVGPRMNEEQRGGSASGEAAEGEAAATVPPGETPPAGSQVAESDTTDTSRPVERVVEPPTELVGQTSAHTRAPVIVTKPVQEGDVAAPVAHQEMGPANILDTSNDSAERQVPMEAESIEETAEAQMPSGRTTVSTTNIDADGPSSSETVSNSPPAETEGFKKPMPKRKSSADLKIHANKQARVNRPNADSESDGYSSDSSTASNVSCSQPSSDVTMYTADYISKFLADTKGKRNVKVDQYFVDAKQFVQDVCHHKQEGAFEDVEVYRLNKILRKVRRQLKHGNGQSLD